MQDTTVPNAKRLLWAGFTAILAAGVGFALRNGMLGAWAAEFHFTATQLGAISGAGFSGFCFGIIFGGVIVDKLGYGKLVAVALVGHIISAIVALGATDATNAYAYLYWGAFIFAYANGTLEAVANPLVATCFPKNRTHYLNILHASWPLGMIVGAGASYLIGAENMLSLSWRWQMAFYLVPTAIYAWMFFGQTFPQSEAAQKGTSFGDMLRDVGILGGAVACYLLTIFFSGALGLDSVTALVIGVLLLIGTAIVSRLIKKPSLESLAAIAVCALIALQAQNALSLPHSAGLALTVALVIGLGITMGWTFGSILLFVLFVTHALVGSVELGTDGWIENITGNLFSKVDGKVLFIWACVIMFSLRFSAHFIETKLKLSPLGILLVSSLLAFVGLRLASSMDTFAAALLAIGIYAVGKTFFWPTMLAIVGDRFPRSGAVAMSIIGGIGMLSAGLIGGPGLGFAKDRFTAETIQTTSPAVYAENKAEKPSKFLNFNEVTAVDGGKLADAKKSVEAGTGTTSDKALVTASIAGDRATLKVDSYIPLTMAGIYLLLLLYFRNIGGYRALKLEEQA